MSSRDATGALTAAGVTKAYGVRPIVVEASLTVGPQARIGLVGPNGVGKTTLLKLLAGIETPDSGRVTRTPAPLEVGYLPQEPETRPDERLLGYLSRRTGVAVAEREVDRLARAMEDEPSLAGAYSEALDRFVLLGGGDLEARAAALCDQLGLGSDRLDVSLTTLSGGQAARASLASILLARFGVFLLDEPTNDLDFEGLELLEGFLRSLRGGVVVVSHDRAFLERTAERIVEIEEGTHRLREYGGGWSEYLRAREIEREQRYAAHHKYIDERNRLAAQARRMREWTIKGAQRAKRKPDDPDKFVRHAAIEGAEKLAARVRSVERRIERLEPVEKPWEPWQLHLELAPRTRAGDVVVRLEDAVVERGTFRLGPLSFEVRWGERVAITGPNGSGKTTLLAAVLGHVPLVSGRRYVGPAVVMGIVEQGRGRIAGGERLLDVVCEQAEVRAEEARTLLAKFGLGAEEVMRPGASLSPGERTRAVLAVLMQQGANTLVLDEPTNHLDLEAIEELEHALTRFDGTVLLVTHDRRFSEVVGADRTVDLSGR